MTPMKIGSVSSRSNDITALLNVVRLLADMAKSPGNPDSELSSLLDGLMAHQASAADRAQPFDANGGSGSDPPGSTRGLMQALAPLIHLMSPMFDKRDPDAAPTGEVPSKPLYSTPLAKAGPAPVGNPGHALPASPAATHLAPPAAGLAATSAPATPGTGTFHARDPSIQQWAPDIAKAAQASGLDPNLIGGQMWRESHGNQATNTKNIDGTRDIGLMQIGQERWSNVLAPALNAKDRAAITAATGKRPEDLQMTDPHDNVIAGAFHLKLNIDKLGGNVHDALTMYVGPNDPTYADSILNKNIPALQAGQNLPDPI